jgi:cell shape-determining protein MreD
VLRAALYIATGWCLIALVAGLGQSLGLTVMLPATSLVVLMHMSFSGADHGELSEHGRGHPSLYRPALAGDLAIALALGYLEDIHQGLLVGTLCLTHGLALLGLRWASYRLTVIGLWSRALVTLLLALFVDLMTAGILLAIGPAIGLPHTAVLQDLAAVPWHALATMLAAPAIWIVLDAVFRLVTRLQELSGRPSAPKKRGPRPSSRGPRPAPRAYPRPNRRTPEGRDP